MDLKKQAALHALQYIRSGNVIGLGSGSTMALFIKALGASLKSGELSDIVAVPTSEETAQQAREVGVKLSTLNEYERLDVAIDGADEVDNNLNLIKGLGRALLREKVVATHADEFIIIVDKTKLVSRPDKSGVFRYTSSSAIPMVHNEYKYFCELDYTKEAQYMRNIILNK